MIFFTHKILYDMVLCKRGGWPTAIATLLFVLAIACSSTPSDPKLTTRLAEGIRGTLIETDGCLRLASGGESRAIVWQKDVFDIARVDDRVEIVDLQLGSPDAPVIWKVGEQIRTSGASNFGPLEFHAGDEFVRGLTS